MITSCTHCASMLIQDKQAHYHHLIDWFVFFNKRTMESYWMCLSKTWTYVNIIMNRSHMSEIASRTGTWLSIFSFCGPVAFVDRTKNGDTSIKLKGYLEQASNLIISLRTVRILFFFSLSFSFIQNTSFFITLTLFSSFPFHFAWVAWFSFFSFYYLHSYSYSPIPFRLCTISTLSFYQSSSTSPCCRNILIVRWCLRQTTICSACVQCVSDVSEYKKPAFATASNILMSIRQSYRMLFNLSFH